jgi:hypothetical protein
LLKITLFQTLVILCSIQVQMMEIMK